MSNKGGGALENESASAMKLSFFAGGERSPNPPPLLHPIRIKGVGSVEEVVARGWRTHGETLTVWMFAPPTQGCISAPHFLKSFFLAMKVYWYMPVNTSPQSSSLSSSSSS